MIRKKCIICGAEFEARQERQKTCSRQCKTKLYYIEHKEEKATKTATCIECGNIFETESAKKKICSESCRRKRDARKMLEHYKKINNNLPERVCPICGETFKPSTINTKTCSRKCAALLVAKTRAEKERECRECGKKFYTACGSKVYCSEKCREAAEKRRKKEQEDAKKAAAEIKRQKQSPAQRRWERMTLREISAECARLHISYGRAQVMAAQDRLPEDFGLGGRKQ